MNGRNKTKKKKRLRPKIYKVKKHTEVEPEIPKGFFIQRIVFQSQNDRLKKEKKMVKD